MTTSLPESSDHPDPRHPSANTIEIWSAACSHGDPGPMEHHCRRWLHDDDVRTADRFRVASARHQHVVGRGMARRLLAAADVPPQQIGFRRLDHGKPIVDQPESARRSFNIAHTRGLVLCGLGATADRNQWLGVDVEALDRRTDPGLANRYFAPEEVRQLEVTASEASRQFLFLKIWTLKEAFIKAIGTGLQTPLDAFAFLRADTDVPQMVLHDPSLSRHRRWHVESFRPRPGFVAAIAIGEPNDGPAETMAIAHHEFESWVQAGGDAES